MVELRPTGMPILDVSVFRDGSEVQRRAQVERLRDSLTRFNFFAFRDGELSLDLAHEVDDLSRTLFALREAQKLAYQRPSKAGYMRYGVEQALRGTRPDLKEMWHAGRDLAPSHALRARFPQSFFDNVWPTEVPALEAKAQALYGQLSRSAETLLELLAALIPIPARQLTDIVVDAPHSFRMIHYPPLPERVAKGEERAVAHTGAGLFGILPPASDEGLEVIDRKGVWQHLVGFDDCSVVTLADLIELLTGDRIPASLHRVVNPTGDGVRKSRYAMVFFVHARPDTPLSLPNLSQPFGVSELHGRTAVDFVRNRMTSVWLNEASVPYRLFWRAKQTLMRWRGDALTSKDRLDR